MRKSTLVASAALILALAHLNLAAPSRSSDEPALREALARVARYVQEYGEKMLLVVGTEHYSQSVENHGWRTLVQTTLVSEFLIVRVGDDWSGFRDVHEVDGKSVGDRQDRLEKLFSQPQKNAIREARQINDESARYNVGAIQRNFNTPTMALFFLQSANQPRFTFKKSGEDKIDGVAVWKIRYDESRRPTIIRTSSGKNMPVSGTIWIDPADGRVLKTHMGIETEVQLGTTTQNVDGTRLPRGAWTDSSAHASASVTVTYKSDPRLGFLVPSGMMETYEGPRPTTGSTASGTTKITCRATYSDFRRFETNSNWSVPK